MADIKGLLMGKDCPHMKDNKGKQNKVSSNCPPSFRLLLFSVGETHCILIFVLQEVLDLAFTITYDVEEYSLNFIAPSRTDVSLAALRSSWFLKVLTHRERASNDSAANLFFAHQGRREHASEICSAKIVEGCFCCARKKEGSGGNIGQVNTRLVEKQRLQTVFDLVNEGFSFSFEFIYYLKGFFKTDWNGGIKYVKKILIVSILEASFYKSITNNHFLHHSLKKYHMFRIIERTFRVHLH